MKINRENYEQFFLDHAEGSLSPELERELSVFLQANPDLKSLLEEFDASPVPLAEISNEPLKKKLKKNIHSTAHINEGNAEEWLISEMEGLHSDTESLELEEFIASNPAYEYDRKMFRATKLQPDVSVIFTHKDKLKKKPAMLWIPRLAWSVPAAAAVILMFFGIRLFYQAPRVEEKPNVAQAEVQQPEVHATEDQQNEVQQTEIPQMEITASELGIQVPKGTPSPGMESPPPIRMLSLSVGEMPVIILPAMSKLALSPRDTEPDIMAMPQEKPLIARVFSNFFSRTGQAVKENLNVGNDRNKEFDFWTLAEAGLKGYNSLSDRDLELMLRRNREGKIKAYALIDEDRLVLSRSLDKN